MTATDSDAAPEPRPIATVRSTRTVAARTIAVSVVAFFGFAYAFGRLRGAIHAEPFEPIVVPAVAPSTVLGWLVVALGVVALVVVPHELLHGVFMARYGGTPSYGVGVSNFLLPYAYATTGGTSYTRNQLLVALLAPFVGITAVGLAAMTIVQSSLLVVALAANAAGSVGDLRMAATLARYPATVRVAERPHADAQGFAVYGSSAVAADRGPRWDAASSIAAGTVGTLVLSTATLGALVFHALAVGTGDVIVGGDGWLLLRHELQADGTVHLELGARLLLAVSIAGGFAWTAIDRARSRFG
ncbi:DUF3267 domain-containing protein [Halosolutus halophilus]|uniref:DUF3267 domain-containing protein n=1 Tax=Halosolutus halophilus TaxID=1552990 RepID=UPI0022352F4D|nr:DUF3267 domain-containing protein [Halosolutus halophilus]